MFDSLGDRMKSYESNVSHRLSNIAPIIGRVDGKNFHSFCRGLAKPFDQRLIDIMIDVASYLLKETGARCAYTQSDEISLCWHSDDYRSEVFLGGKSQKMSSIISSMATAKFLSFLHRLPEKSNLMPIFDGRVFPLPIDYEATNYFIWREQDAVRNSIQSAARSVYSYKQCYKANCHVLQDMLMEKGINWNDYPSSFKRGTYVIKREKDGLSYFDMPDLPKLSSIKNATNVLLRGEDFILKEEINV